MKTDNAAVVIGKRWSRVMLGGAALAAMLAGARAGDQPQWGAAWSRNMISEERGLPERFDPATGVNILWRAKLGTESHSSPVVAGGRVYVGTNNGVPRDSKHDGDRGVLMCFREADGEFLWQLVAPKREEDSYFDWPNSGISSPATVEGERVYIVSNRGEVMCLDAKGLTDGNDGFQEEGRQMTRQGTALLEAGPADADVLWAFDLMEGAGIWPHDAAHSSILIYGPHLYLNTGTGVDNTHRKIRTPDAPSLVVLDKATGRLLARDRENIAPQIFHSTWAAPSLGVIEGKPRIFFAGGDGIVYGFEPIPTNGVPAGVQSLKAVWKFDLDPEAPKTEVHRYNTNRREGPSNVYGMPVFHEGKVFVAGGGDLFWGKIEAWLKAIDATGRGDGTATAQLWSAPLVRHTVSTAAIAGGLVFIADCGRTVHCLDLAGKSLWIHETRGDIWASPLLADGKVYIGTRRGDFWVFAASAEKKVLHHVELGRPISATAAAANGVLYVATMTDLFAFKEGAKAP